MPAEFAVVRSLQGLEALKPSWDSLPAATALPTLSHAWVLSCARTLYADDDLYVIIVFVQGILAGILPLVAQRHAGIKRLELIGASKLYEPSGVLYDSAGTLDVLLEALLHTRKPVLLSRIPLRSAIVSRLQSVAGGRGLLMTRRVSGTLAVPIASAWSEYVSRLSAQRRYDLRRARRRAEEAGSVRVRIHAPRPDEVDPMLAEFIRIESAGWKSRNRSSLSERPDLTAFFRQYAQVAATSGILRVSFLEIGGESVAAQLSVEYANRLWVLKIGYDERWSRCSPGWQLLAETMRDAFDRTLTSYEFLGSDEPWLRGWVTEERELCTAAWYPVTPLGLYGLAADTTTRVRARAAGAWSTRDRRE